MGNTDGETNSLGERLEFDFKWFPLEAGISSSEHRLIKIRSMISCLSTCAESGETGLLQLADCPQQLLSVGEVRMSPGQGPK